jgi:hypothetical protein
MTTTAGGPNPLSPNVPMLRPGVSLQVQSVLFKNDIGAVERTVESLARSADLAISSGICGSVTLRYGDSSEMPCLDEAALSELRASYGTALTIEYDHFRGNLGSAGGHNRLARESLAEFLLIQNPDVVVSPRLIEQLLRCFAQAGVGMAEAKQVPIEHPKDYDPVTGETSWATTACAMIPTALFRQLDGFDADSFFLYCDDVDFSWRVRLAGFYVIFQPAAVAFHDKRLSPAGRWQPSTAERYYSAEASLMLCQKWSRHDLLEKYLFNFRKSSDTNLVKASGAFTNRRKTGTLPTPIDPDHRIGQFVDIFYAKHRYPL